MRRSITAVAPATNDGLNRLGDNFHRSFPYVETQEFDEILTAIDGADRDPLPRRDTITNKLCEQLLLNENAKLREEIAQLQARVSELTSLAHIDPLVGLANRRLFERELANAIARVDRYGGSAAVVFVDVDGLKRINDQFGHTTGDAALVKVAQILIDNVRASDVVARLSGDEFAILMSDGDEMSAWNMAFRIIESTLAARLWNGGDSIPLSVAAGASESRPGDRPDDVILRADKAMYRIKSVSA